MSAVFGIAAKFAGGQDQRGAEPLTGRKQTVSEGFTQSVGTTSGKLRGGIECRFDFLPKGCEVGIKKCVQINNRKSDRVLCDADERTFLFLMFFAPQSSPYQSLMVHPLRKKAIPNRGAPRSLGVSAFRGLFPSDMGKCLSLSARAMGHSVSIFVIPAQAGIQPQRVLPVFLISVYAGVSGDEL